MLRDEIDFEIIDEAKNAKEGIFNLRSKNIFRYFKIVKKADIVHIHSGVFILRMFHIMLCRIFLRKFTVVTIHHDPNTEKHILLTKWLLSRCNHAILVNKQGYEMMKIPSTCKYHLLPAFLPPIIDEEPFLPLEVTKWIHSRRAEGSSVSVSNAWNLLLHNGIDLYGLDLCIEAFRLLNEKTKGKYSLLFVVASNTSNQEMIEIYKKKIAEYHLEKNILIWEEPLSFVRLVMESDLVLRATNTDGDALSLREALFMGKTVIASDVVNRPDGTVLFKNRDANDLAKKIEENVNNIGVERKHVTNNFANDYLKIYYS